MAIIIVLAVIGGIALLLRIVRRKHKKSLAFYLILFAVFTATFFLSALLIDRHGSLYSVIDGAIHVIVVTVLWWFFDQGHEQIKTPEIEDEADSKRKATCSTTIKVAVGKHAHTLRKVSFSTRFRRV